MNRRFRRALVVGKFSPLHRGHEAVVRRAHDLSDEVVIVSYSKPEFAGCEPPRRERWLAELFPAARCLVATDERLRAWRSDDDGPAEIPPNDADETTHRRFVGWLCWRVLGVGVDAVFTSEDYGDGFAAELTRYFRQHDAVAPVVQHVLVDRARRAVPISATAIRADIHAHRQWLAPAVYASFVERVCLLGGESTGKSLLAQLLAREFKTVHVAEFGRELWEAQGGALAFEDLGRIAVEQVAREEAAARRAGRFLFCDTSPLTTLFYSHAMFDRVDSEVERLAERSYDHVILCAPDFPFVQDGTRRDEAFRRRQHAWYEAELARRGVPFAVVGGSVEQRIAAVKSILLRPGNSRPRCH